MKLLTLATLFYAATLASAAPPTERDLHAAFANVNTPSIVNELEKRRGGGGGGGGRTGGGSGSGTGGGRTGSGSGSPGRPVYSFDSGSNVGGRTRDGSGTPPSYSGRYTGGATVPYTASRTTPRGVGAYALFPLAILPGLWLYPAFAFAYPINYRWNNNGREQTCNVTCLCQEYSVCGCEPDNNATYVQQVVTNNGASANGAPVNSSLNTVVNYPNGTCVNYINGTLENGTTAAGGTDPSNDSQVSPAARLVIDYGGYWMMVTTVLAGVLMV